MESSRHVHLSELPQRSSAAMFVESPMQVCALPQNCQTAREVVEPQVTVISHLGALLPKSVVGDPSAVYQPTWRSSPRSKRQTHDFV